MSKAARDASVRARIAAQREAQRKQEQRRRLATIITIVVVVLAVIGGGWWYAAEQTKSETVAGGLAPVTVQSDGSVVMAKAGVTTPVLDIFEDPQCPVCKQLEEISGPTIKNLAAEGKVKVVYHPLTIFSQEPTRSNSLRAASALRCVPDGKQWLAFHDRIFKEQPSETVEGFKIDDLIKWGHDVGVTAPGFDSCVKDQTHKAAHEQFSTKTMADQQLQGTPTLKLNGAAIDNNTIFVPSALRQEILNAAGAK
ncbi:thioredoxin domain-containing protein [Microtetraspora sp. AC03309]|uniref:thioredoxin domain-containing protein n=1 Tax=Microtetraspora sp. AC03309 TaxID=2779376 RepID=UPI001E42C572|nr:thioredoxin domain-containing protein [Microtetraspora sp. AC03309]MCC5575553.1 thioredoxin domain-containing protein [Microtetraspora sp. AC03309]